MANKLFTKYLMLWHQDQNDRCMPWKGEKDPYKVWLSEIILQQTRVNQGLAYYNRFVQQYPDIASLAEADDEKVFKLWEGLGYYSRCNNLLHTARHIHFNLQGIFPKDYTELLKLKGIGSYTAAAIASFCYGLPIPVLDGNVFRVLSRVYSINTPVDTKDGRIIIQKLAEKHIALNNPGAFNQAIMDFGATICKPALPLCTDCTLNTICTAYIAGNSTLYPVKAFSMVKKERWFSYLIIECNGKFLVRKRTSKGIWQNLYEYYLIESSKDPCWNDKSITAYIAKCLQLRPESVMLQKAKRQILTHQLINGWFIKVEINDIPANWKLSDYTWRTAKELDMLPFPRFINQNKKVSWYSEFCSNLP